MRTSIANNEPNLFIYAVAITEELPMADNEKTSKKVATKASKILRDPKSTKDQKSVAASALTQTADKKKKKN